MKQTFFTIGATILAKNDETRRRVASFPDAPQQPLLDGIRENVKLAQTPHQERFAAASGTPQPRRPAVASSSPLPIPNPGRGNGIGKRSLTGVARLPVSRT
jgi:hypothetical protein